MFVPSKMHYISLNKGTLQLAICKLKLLDFSRSWTIYHTIKLSFIVQLMSHCSSAIKNPLLQNRLQRYHLAKMFYPCITAKRISMLLCVNDARYLRSTREN